jgi:hypothetical protein
MLFNSLLNDTADRYARIFCSMRKRSLWMTKANEFRKISDFAERIAQLVEDRNHFAPSVGRNRFRNQVICLEDRLLLEKVKSFV